MDSQDDTQVFPSVHSCTKGREISDPIVVHFAMQSILKHGLRIVRMGEQKGFDNRENGGLLCTGITLECSNSPQESPSLVSKKDPSSTKLLHQWKNL